MNVHGVSELVLEVADLEAAERFYTGALGLPVVERYASGEAIWLMAGDHARIGLWLPQLGVAGGRGGAHVHFALHVENQDFDASVRRLREHGLTPQIESRRRYRPSASRSAYVFDPDGNCVELWTQDLPSYVRRVTGKSPPRANDPHADSGPVSFARDAWWNQSTVRAHLARTRIETAVRLLGVGPGSVLEVNAGSGRLIAALVNAGWSVTGVDPRPQLIELARLRIPEAADRLTVSVADSLPFPDCSFDAGAVAGLHEPDNLPGVLAELARVVRPGGRIAVALRNRRTPVTIWRLGIVYPLARALKGMLPFGRRPPKDEGWPLSPKRIEQLIADVGLVVEQVQLTGCDVVPDPIDRFAAGFSYRAARSAERSAKLRRIFATQRIVLAGVPERPLGPVGVQEPVAIQDHPAQR
jgi:SAM-dependent methyltransferase/catechol 2,3-dioxygenase-like lactoylglutathione lyase family enzyme